MEFGIPGVFLHELDYLEFDMSKKQTIHGKIDIANRLPLVRAFISNSSDQHDSYQICVLIDTGASNNWITSEFAETLGLIVKLEDENGKFYDDALIALPNNDFEPCPFWARKDGFEGQLHKLADTVGMPAVLLGNEFLMSQKCKFTLDGATLEFSITF